MAEDDKKPEDEEVEASKAAPAKSVGGKALPVKKKKKKKGPAVAEKRADDDPDALMTTTLRAMEWANKRWKHIVGVLVTLAVAGGVYWAYTAYRAGREEKASSFAEGGAFAELVDPHAWDQDQGAAALAAKRLPSFPDADARQKAVLASYGSAHAQYPDTGPAILARLAEAGVHLDRGEWQPAIDAYTEVQSSKLAPVDPELKVRCLEGIGYAYEGLGKPDDARKSFDALANLDTKGAKALGMYHLARLDVAANQKDAAITKLKSAHDAVAGASAGFSAYYLKNQIEGLLGQLDPSALPKKPATPDFQHMTQEEMQQYIQNMQQNGGGPQ